MQTVSRSPPLPDRALCQFMVVLFIVQNTEPQLPATESDNNICLGGYLNYYVKGFIKCHMVTHT